MQENITKNINIRERNIRNIKSDFLNRVSQHNRPQCSNCGRDRTEMIALIKETHSNKKIKEIKGQYPQHQTQYLRQRVANQIGKRTYHALLETQILQQIQAT